MVCIVNKIMLEYFYAADACSNYVLSSVLIYVRLYIRREERQQTIVLIYWRCLKHQNNTRRTKSLFKRRGRHSLKYFIVVLRWLNATYSTHLVKARIRSQRWSRLRSILARQRFLMANNRWGCFPKSPKSPSALEKWNAWLQSWRMPWNLINENQQRTISIHQQINKLIIQHNLNKWSIN